jgi:hypothetical protein
MAFLDLDPQNKLNPDPNRNRIQFTGVLDHKVSVIPSLNRSNLNCNPASLRKPRTA